MCLKVSHRDSSGRLVGATTTATAPPQQQHTNGDVSKRREGTATGGGVNGRQGMQDTDPPKVGIRAEESAVGIVEGAPDGVREMEQKIEAGGEGGGDALREMEILEVGADEDGDGLVFSRKRLQEYVLMCSQQSDGGLRDKPGK